MGFSMEDDIKQQQERSALPMLWIGIVSIVMLFAGFTSAAIVSHMSGSWIHIKLPWYFIASTAIIVASSFTYHYAFKLMQRKELAFSVRWIILSLILGAGFGIFQYLGWKELVKQGVYFTGPTANPAGSYFYVITFVHFLHYIGGIISMLVVYFRAKSGKYLEKSTGFKISLIYWHFLDVLWLYLYAFLYYLINN